MLKPKENKSTASPCDSKRIFQAISILKQLNQKFCETKEKKSLLDDETENPIILQLTMKKIPPLTMQKFVKVHLPNSILNDKKEVCLITGDLDKRNTKAEVEPDVLHFKELLKKENISKVNEVITLRQLRKEYKPFEARRQLCGAYDVFLCDKRIAGVLPRTLGKSFFRKRKLPIQINMQTPKLKEQIENALSSTVFHITCKGNSCASEVANLAMNEKDISSNIMSSIDALKEQLPGQWDNILGIYVKTPKSKAIPLYMSNDDPNEFNFTKKRTRSKFVTAELSTLLDTDVKVFRDGRVVVKRPKKKEEDSEILSELEENSSNHEMKETEETSNLSASDGEVATNDTDKVKKSEKKSRKRKSNLGSNEESSQVEEKIENSEVEKPEKTRKKPKSNLKFYDESAETEITEENNKNSIKSIKGKAKKKEVKETEVETEEPSSLPASDGEVADKVKKLEKKSRKRKSNLGSNEESSQVKEKIETPEVEKPEKTWKKPKSNLKKFNDSAETEITEENIKNSIKSMKGKVKKKKNQN